MKHIKGQQRLFELNRLKNPIFAKYDLMKKISQAPVILVPLNWGVEGNRSIGIRPVITNDYMTAVPAIPGVDFPEYVLEEMVKRIFDEVPNISSVLYDITSKPPATIEWE